MIRVVRNGLPALLFVLLGTLTASANAAVADLIGSLTSNLGVSEPQARGGAGAIFGMAQDNLSPTDFTKVTDAVPGVPDLIAAAPSPGGASGMGGMMGSAASALGGGGLSGLTSLAGSFQQLGMSPDMVQKFVPIVLDFVQTQGGDSVRSLLQGALM